MALPHIRPTASRQGTDGIELAPKAGSLAGVDPEATIIGRRDVAIVPWVTIAMVAVAVAISTALRPPGSVSEPLVIGASLAYAAFAAVLATLQDKPYMQRVRRSLATYLAGSLFLVAMLALVACLDRGLATVYFAPIVQVAAYLGLVLPSRWSRRALVVLLGTCAGVQAITPDASWLDAATVAGLVVAGWLVGVLCHSAHGRSARIALILSNSDVLTGALNRRGFFDQFDHELAIAKASAVPTALLIIDLDGFKVVNDEQGHAAGDDLLRWVGHTIPAALPANAALGRLGGDEFGVVLPGATRTSAGAIAKAVHDAIAERIEASVGVASSEDPATTADDYLRVADAALYACKATDGLQIQSLVAGSTQSGLGHIRRSAPSRPPALTYAVLRAAGGPPQRPAQGIHFGWLLRGGFWVIAISGAMLILATAIDGASNRWDDAILLFGGPWVLANLVLGWVNFGSSEVLGRRILVARLSSSMLVGVGIGLAMLAHGGITAPVVAGLYLKVLFDATVLARKEARDTALISIAWWAVAVVLGPHADLWAVPYQLTLFAVSFGLGIVGRRAFTDATSHRLRLAHTDALTGLRNRPGFTQGAERAFAAAQAEQRPFAIVAFDLDDFKGVNDTQGHAAGDLLLQAVAEITKATLPTAYSVGRLGGDEFVAAVAAGSVEEAAALASALTAKLASRIGASIGCAVYPADGDSLEALLRSADHRSYSAKPGRTRHSPLTAVDDGATGFAAA